jgi:hypothetical protein
VIKLSNYELIERLRQTCPIDLREAIKTIKAIQLNLWMRGPANKLYDKVIDARGLLEILIGQINSVLRDGEILEKMKDKETYGELTNNMGRILKILDLKEAVIMKDAVIISEQKIKRYAVEIETVLYRDILYPLLEASKKEPKDKKAFLYAFTELSILNAAVFGAISREISIKKITEQVPLYKEELKASEKEMKKDIKQLKKLEDDSKNG